MIVLVLIVLFRFYASVTSSCHHLHFCIFLFPFILIFFFFFNICSPNHQLISCNTSENVSPVKQAPRKSPFDTEGLVKSLPSGSHQVTADCSSAHCTTLCSLVLCLIPGLKKNTELWETGQEKQEGIYGWFRRTMRTYVKRNLTCRGFHQTTSNTLAQVKSGNGFVRCKWFFLNCSRK